MTFRGSSGRLSRCDCITASLTGRSTMLKTTLMLVLVRLESMGVQRTRTA